MKKAKGFGIYDRDTQDTFALGADRNNTAEAARGRIEQATDAGLAESTVSNSAEEVIRLDIDNVDLVKTLKAPKKKETKTEKKIGALKAYKRLNGMFTLKRGINIREKQNFYELLAVMLEAGISLNQAMTIYYRQTDDSYFKEVCQAITYQLEKGESFSQALLKYKHIFNESELGVIMAAEVSGRLVEAMRRLAIEVENTAELRRKVTSALIYPFIVILFVIATIFILLKYVIPQISTLFTDSNLDLPALTVLVVEMSQFVVDNTLFIMLAIGAFIALNIVLYRIPQTRYWYHYAALHIPVLGAFQRNVMQANFAGSIANLVASGVRIVQALEITANSLSNLVYRRQVRLLAKDVTNGIQIADSLQNSPYFTPMLVNMVSVGEKTAQLDNITNKLSQYYSDQVTYMAENLTKLLQPFVIAVVGSVVGIVVLAIMLPMTQLLNSVSSF